MLFRSCSGGIVFYKDDVLLLQNDKNEWVLPKGVIRNGMLSREVAAQRVLSEANVRAAIVSPAGETSYEFYSHTRKQPVCNEITWYIMRAESAKCHANVHEGFIAAEFFPMDIALPKITYSQDRVLVELSYKRYQDIVKSAAPAR